MRITAGDVFRTEKHAFQLALADALRPHAAAIREAAGRDGVAVLALRPRGDVRLMALAAGWNGKPEVVFPLPEERRRHLAAAKGTRPIVAAWLRRTGKPRLLVLTGHALHLVNVLADGLLEFEPGSVDELSEPARG